MNAILRMLKKLIRTITFQNFSKLEYQVLDAGELIKRDFHNSTGYFFDEHIKEYPAGVWFIGGSDAKISVAYDNRKISRNEIERFIRKCGISIECVKHSEPE